MTGTNEIKKEIVSMLEQSIRKGNLDAVREQLQAMSGPLEGKAAGRALALALDTPVETFRAVLDRCAPGEYALGYRYGCATQRAVFFASGTITTLAAMKNRAEHLGLLLERGWDPNSDSEASRVALEQGEADMALTVTAGWVPASAHPNLIRSGVMRERENRLLLIHHCTPLAAAIFCGSAEAARLLWDHPGVRRLEDESVCRAIVCDLQLQLRNDESPWPWRMKPDPRNTVGMDLLGGIPGIQLPRLALQPHAWAEEAHPFCLRVQMRADRCDEDELMTLVRFLDPRNPRWQWENHRALDPALEPFRRDPEHVLPEDAVDPILPQQKNVHLTRNRICFLAMRLHELAEELRRAHIREGWIAGTYLRICVLLRLMAPDWTMLVTDLKNDLHSFCSPCNRDGKESPLVDLSWASWELGLLSPEQLGVFLRILSDGARLVIDSCANAAFFTPEHLEELVRRVRFRPVEAPKAVYGRMGALSWAILETGNAKLAMKAAERGCFHGEARQLLENYRSLYPDLQFQVVMSWYNPVEVLPADEYRVIDPEKELCFV